jgi:gamma-glutamyltranspeptidase/glutathione hydrolase
VLLFSVRGGASSVGSGPVVAAVVVLLLLLSGGRTAAAQTPDPLSASAFAPTERAVSDSGMVAAAHPRAVEAGRAVLADGGTAVDAAVATAFALHVLEPMMSGLGGGGSMTYWDPTTETARFVDYYASAGADPDHGLNAVPDSARSRERMVAVPGTVAGLLSAHAKYGELSRERVMAPAIRLAREGFTVHTLLARIIENYEERLTYDADAAALFYPDGTPLQAGDRLVQTELARTLDRIADRGAEGFYEGPTAEAVVDRLAEGDSPLTTADLAAFEPRWRAPLCGTYGPYTVLSATPSLNGVEVIETLNLLSGYDLPALGLPTRNAEALGRLVDAIRIARADRLRWIGDPDETGVPAVGLASPAFADTRRSLVGGPVPDSMAAGDPWPIEANGRPARCEALGSFPPTSLPRPEPTAPSPDTTAPDTTDADAHTTHISVVDADGRAVSLTETMGLYFGSAVYVNGFFLNSAAMNFGDSTSRPVANRRAGRRTPRSSTAPTLFLEDGAVRLVVGSPGSGRIPPTIVQMALYTLDYGLDPAQAVRMPRVYPLVERPTVRLEGGVAAPALAPLRERGYDLEVYPPFDLYFGGVHVIYVDEEGRRVGAADPRRYGTARGQ